VVWRQIHKVLGMEELSMKELFSRPRRGGMDDDAAAGPSSDAAAETEAKQNGDADTRGNGTYT